MFLRRERDLCPTVGMRAQVLQAECVLHVWNVFETIITYFYPLTRLGTD